MDREQTRQASGAEEANDRKGAQTLIERAPIDMNHLARYTLGDVALEREVLELFCTQFPPHLEQLRSATSHKDRSDAAHSLKGSASAVGAWRVARAAQALEALQGDVSAAEWTAQIGELEASFEEATAFIANLRGAQSG